MPDKKLNNGETLYYHPVLEAKLVSANGFVFSLMTEFIENTSPQESKQDCELKAFYRLRKRLKARFPHLPICLLRDGLFAGGPTFQIIHNYNWRYLIVLKDKDLTQIHRTYELVLPQTPENRKQMCLDAQQEIVQEYHWATQIDYLDSQNRHHRLNVIPCKETKVSTHTTTFKWLTNFIPMCQGKVEMPNL